METDSGINVSSSMCLIIKSFLQLDDFGETGVVKCSHFRDKSKLEDYLKVKKDYEYQD